MRNSNSLLLGLLLLSSVRLLAQNEEPCKLILQNGLYKTFTIQRQSSFHQDLKTYFSSEEFKKDFKEGKWGGFLSVIVDALPIKLGVNASDQQISEFQQKISHSTNLTLTQSFYDYANTRIPDVELAKAYNECIGIRPYGFTIKPAVTDKEVMFVVSYRNQVEGDPMPRVIRFEVKNAGNVSKSFNTGDILKGETVINAERDPEKDLTFVLETDRGIATYKVPADPSGFNKDFPIGTIITSYLNWTEFQVATKNNSINPLGNLFSSKYSKWAPADGREIPNSAFQRITNQLNVPDLRGVFLRGLNQFDQDQGTFVADNRKDPENRVRGSFQPQSVQPHSHSIFDPGHAHAIGLKQPGAGGIGATGIDATAPKFDHGTEIAKTGIIKTENNDGVETRPNNVSIYYYIRIN